MATKRANAGGTTRKAVGPKPRRASRAAKPEPESAEAGNVDKIRDILFGNQMREYDARFRRMEEALQQHLDELRMEVSSRQESLQAHFKREMGDLRAALGREADERATAAKQVSDELARSVEATDRRLGQMTDDLDQRAAELREHILQQSQSLSQEIAERGRRLSEEVSRRTRGLDEAKLDRGVFAGFLVDLATRVSGEEHGDAGSAGTA